MSLAEKIKKLNQARNLIQRGEYDVAKEMYREKLDESKNPRRFFDDRNKFVPGWLADEIVDNEIIITFSDNNDIFVYDEKEGIYIAGEQLIRTKAQTLLCDLSKKGYCDETLHYIKNATQTNREELKAPTRLVAVQNGLIDLRNEWLLPFNPKYFFTAKLPIKFDIEAKSPIVESFFENTLELGDREIILEIFSYCLLRDYPIQKAIMFVGEGSNGKSVMINLLKAFLGQDNICSLSIQELCESRFSKGILYNKLANLYADVPTRMLKDVGTFKMLVGGDQHTADVKFKTPFNFTNYAKLIFSANIIPATGDDTDAFFRRWIIINFPRTFTDENRDVDLVKKLTTPPELSGLLNLAIKRLNLLLIAGSFSNSKATKEVRDEYIRKSDPIGAFILDMIEETQEGSEPKERVYNAFLDYAKARKLPVMDMMIFSKRFKTKIKISEERSTINGERVRSWKGILLRLEEPEEPQNTQKPEKLIDF